MTDLKVSKRASFETPSDTLIDMITALREMVVKIPDSAHIVSVQSNFYTKPRNFEITVEWEADAEI